METGLPQRLRKLREELELSQQDFAERIGVARTTFASWESGNRRPELAHLESIARLGGVSVDWLLGRMGADETHPHTVEDLVIIYRGKRQELSEPYLWMVKKILEDQALLRADKKGEPDTAEPQRHDR